MYNNLNDVILARIEAKIKRGSELGEKAIGRLIREAEVSNDFIAYLGGERRQMSFEANDTFNMYLKNQNGYDTYDVSPHAITQLGAKLEVPTAYIKQLAGVKSLPWQKVLAAEILNKHATYAKQNRMLIRSVDGTVRGVLSDSYRRMNSIDLITSFATEIQAKGAVICDGMMNDTKIFLEAINPHPVIVETPKNGQVLMVFGARISTSDYGDGALDLRSFYLQGVCCNGLVRESMLKQVHLGGKLPENIQLSEETYRSDTHTQSLAIRDISRTILSDEYTMKRTLEIQAASNMDIDVEHELNSLSKGKMTKSEVEEVGKLLTQNDPNDGLSGSATLWKLTQGITAYANKIDDTLRIRELHEVGGQLLNRVKVA